MVGKCIILRNKLSSASDGLSRDGADDGGKLPNIACQTLVNLHQELEAEVEV